MKTAGASAQQPRFGMLRTIALYKLLKVLLLLSAAYGVLRLHDDASLSTRLLSWAAARPEGPEHDIVVRSVEWFSGLSDRRIHELRVVTLSYAAVFAVEGVGLWMRRRWAEWMTSIITASLIPLEVWEFLRGPSVGKAAVIAANVAIVAYLVWLLLRKPRPH